MNYHEGQGASHTDHNFNAYYIGKVEASMSGQIEALKKSFAQVFGESKTKNEMDVNQNE
jgi:hypothetical protein